VVHARAVMNVNIDLADVVKVAVWCLLQSRSATISTQGQGQGQDRDRDQK